MLGVSSFHVGDLELTYGGGVGFLARSAKIGSQISKVYGDKIQGMYVVKMDNTY